jgi:prepilin-type N-terminal cleavage/methylation domain-containing protein
MKKGFTSVEVMMVVAIIALIAAIFIPDLQRMGYELLAGLGIVLIPSFWFVGIIGILVKKDV